MRPKDYINLGDRLCPNAIASIQWYVERQVSNHNNKGYDLEFVGTFLMCENAREKVGLSILENQ